MFRVMQGNHEVMLHIHGQCQLNNHRMPRNNSGTKPRDDRRCNPFHLEICKIFLETNLGSTIEINVLVSRLGHEYPFSGQSSLRNKILSILALDAYLRSSHGDIMYNTLVPFFKPFFCDPPAQKDKSLEPMKTQPTYNVSASSLPL